MYELSAAVVDLPPHDPEDVAHLPRLPVLEGLLARADRLDPTSDWRRFALRSVSFDWPAGDLPLARALAECAGLARVGTYLQLSPQHLIAGLSSVHYDPKGPVAVDPTTLEALCDAYALEFGDDPVALRCVEG